MQIISKNPEVLIVLVFRRAILLMSANKTGRKNKMIKNTLSAMKDFNKNELTALAMMGFALLVVALVTSI